MVTHAIAEDDTEYNFSEARELFEIPVVTVSLSFYSWHQLLPKPISVIMLLLIRGRGFSDSVHVT